MNCMSFIVVSMKYLMSNSYMRSMNIIGIYERCKPKSNIFIHEKILR